MSSYVLRSGFWFGREIPLALFSLEKMQTLYAPVYEKYGKRICKDITHHMYTYKELEDRCDKHKNNIKSNVERIFKCVDMNDFVLPISNSVVNDYPVKISFVLKKGCNYGKVMRPIFDGWLGIELQIETKYIVHMYNDVVLPQKRNMKDLLEDDGRTGFNFIPDSPKSLVHKRDQLFTGRHKLTKLKGQPPLPPPLEDLKVADIEEDAKETTPTTEEPSTQTPEKEQEQEEEKELPSPPKKERTRDPSPDRQLPWEDIYSPGLLMGPHKTRRMRACSLYRQRGEREEDNIVSTGQQEDIPATFWTEDNYTQWKDIKSAHKEGERDCGCPHSRNVDCPSPEWDDDDYKNWTLRPATPPLPPPSETPLPSQVEFNEGAAKSPQDVAQELYEKRVKKLCTYFLVQNLMTYNEDACKKLFLDNGLDPEEYANYVGQERKEKLFKEFNIDPDDYEDEIAASEGRSPPQRRKNTVAEDDDSVSSEFPDTYGSYSNWVLKQKPMMMMEVDGDESAIPKQKDRDDDDNDEDIDDDDEKIKKNSVAKYYEHVLLLLLLYILIDYICSSMRV